MQNQSKAPQTNAFARFRASALPAAKAKEVKGGTADTIIIEEITAG